MRKLAGQRLHTRCKKYLVRARLSSFNIDKMDDEAASIAELKDIVASALEAKGILNSIRVSSEILNIYLHFSVVFYTF